MPKPANSIVQTQDDADPWIRGFRCGECGAVATRPTLACRRCSSRNAPEPFSASCKGSLHTWTVVERSYPGIEVPFISAIIDLEDGLTLKGILRSQDTSALREGMAVELVFDDAGGACDEDGTTYVGYHFIPAGEEAQHEGVAP